MQGFPQRAHRRYRKWIVSGLSLSLLGSVTGLIGTNPAILSHHRDPVRTPVSSPYQADLALQRSRKESLTAIRLPYVPFHGTTAQLYLGTTMGRTKQGLIWLTYTGSPGSPHTTVWLDPWHGHAHPILHFAATLQFFSPTATWVTGTWMVFSVTEGSAPHVDRQVWWLDLATGHYRLLSVSSVCEGFTAPGLWGCTTGGNNHQPGIVLSEAHPKLPPKHLPSALSVLLAGPKRWFAQWGPPDIVTIQDAEFIKSERLGWYDPASGTFQLKTTVVNRGAPPHFDVYEQQALHPKQSIFSEWKWSRGVLWWPGWGPTWDYIPEQLNLNPTQKPPLRLASVWGNHFAYRHLPPDPIYPGIETGQGSNFLVRISPQDHHFWIGLPGTHRALVWHAGGTYSQLTLLSNGVLWNVHHQTWLWRAQAT